MKIEFGGCCFRVTLEMFWLGPEPSFRRHRIAPGEAMIRRNLLRSIQKRMKA